MAGKALAHGLLCWDVRWEASLAGGTWGSQLLGRDFSLLRIHKTFRSGFSGAGVSCVLESGCLDAVAGEESSHRGAFF